MNFSFNLLPQQASTVAHQVDAITLGLLILCSGILLLVLGLLITFSFLYRKGSNRNREIKARGASILEWGWTSATLLIFLVLFVWAAVIFVKMHVSPPEASEIHVVGKQWMWKFQHPSGRREINELHVPIGKPILLSMISEDVIHSLFIPEFRIKQDVLPDRYTRTWFQADKVGEYHLFCSQYCGTMHAKMGGQIFVLSASDYQKWLETGQTEFSPLLLAPKRGARLFTQLGCISCHSPESTVPAPSLVGIFGKKELLSNGQSVLVDENYLRESILLPNAKIVRGYSPVMPSYSGLVSEGDVLDLISYLKSLQTHPVRETP